GGQGQDQGGEERPAPFAVGEPEGHADQADHGPDGQVDAAPAGHDQQQLGQAGDGQGDHRLQGRGHVGQVVGGDQVAAGAEGEEPRHQHDQQDGEQGHAVLEQGPCHRPARGPPGPAARPAGGPPGPAGPAGFWGLGVGGHSDRLLRWRRRSTPTATRMNTPMNRAVSSLGHPSRVTAALTVPTSRAPSTVPSTVPRPPRMLVPPMTTAAITWSSKPVPTAWPMRPPPPMNTTAASPTMTPVTTETKNT